MIMCLLQHMNAPGHILTSDLKLKLADLEEIGGNAGWLTVDEYAEHSNYYLCHMHLVSRGCLK